MKTFHQEADKVLRKMGLRFDAYHAEVINSALRAAYAAGEADNWRETAPAFPAGEALYLALKELTNRFASSATLGTYETSLKQDAHTAMNHWLYIMEVNQNKNQDRPPQAKSDPSPIEDIEARSWKADRLAVVAEGMRLAALLKAAQFLLAQYLPSPQSADQLNTSLNSALDEWQAHLKVSPLFDDLTNQTQTLIAGQALFNALSDWYNQKIHAGDDTALVKSTERALNLWSLAQTKKVE